MFLELMEADHSIRGGRMQAARIQESDEPYPLSKAQHERNEMTRYMTRREMLAGLAGTAALVLGGTEWMLAASSRL